MSYHSLNTNSLNATLALLMKRGATVGLGVGAALTPMLALANPSGGTVVAGSATIAAKGANGLVVKQASQAAIVNWQQFNIGRGQYVQFLQPSSSSVILNRVIGGNASSILGNMSANGQVFLINTNGMVFGKSARIDVGGLLASTLDIKNSDFMAGRYSFTKGSGSPDAQITNQGILTAEKGGYIVLAGDYAENAGIITAKSGHVVLASGTQTTLTLDKNNLVSFAVNGATLAHLAGVSNSGQLIADNGTVVMTADVANALKATVVNNTGLVEAHSISNQGGAIYLTANGGNIQNSGTLDASAVHGGQAGGTIVLKGDARTTLTDTSKIMALGQGANGGHLEVSGNTIFVRGKAALGKGGHMLLDPGHMQIVENSASSSINNPGNSSNNTSAGSIGVHFIEGQLNQGAAVTISAANLIDASSAVHAINGTNANGDLTLEANGGQINLSGVNITIKGTLTANMGYGTFGYLQAGAMDLEADSYVRLPSAVAAGGVITKNSAKTTTGDLVINASQIQVGGGSGESGLALRAKGELDVFAAIGHSGSHFGQNVRLVAGTNIVDTQDIFANGAVTAIASAGYASMRNVSGSQGVSLSAAGNMSFEDIHAAYGGISITDTAAGKISGYGSINANHGDITISAANGDVLVGHVIANSGSIAISAKGGHNLQLIGSSGYGLVDGNGGVAITAKEIDLISGGSLDISAGEGDITVKGFFGHSGLHVFNHTLFLDAAGAINLNHSLKAQGSVTLTGNSLAYTGTGKTFSISAYGGNLTLDASIGSAGNLQAYNGSLKDTNDGLFVDRSIYVGSTASGGKANITALQTGNAFAACTLSCSHNPPVGVLVGSAEAAITLSAKGNISLTGHDVGVGAVLGNSSTAQTGPITIKAGGSASFAAVGSSHGGGHVSMRAGRTDVTNGSSDRSILVRAGKSININGAAIEFHGGMAHAVVDNSASAASANANLTLKAATGDINITGSNSEGGIFIGAGRVQASAGEAGSGSHTATANANVNISAGGSVNVSTTGNLNISGGYGAFAAAHAGSNTVSAIAAADVAISAKQNINLTAGNNNHGVHINAGDLGGQGSVGAFTSSGVTAASAQAVTHADVSLNATGAITMTGAVVSLEGGYGVGVNNHTTGSPSFITTQMASAEGLQAKASLTATGDVNLTAGSGGITLQTQGAIGSGGVSVSAGYGAGQRAFAFADNGGSAAISASASVKFNTTGNVNFRIKNYGNFSGHQAGSEAQAIGNNDLSKASVAVHSDVSVSGKNINVTSGGESGANVNLRSFRAGAGNAIIANGYGAMASIDDTARVDFNATGNIKITDGTTITLTAASAGNGFRAHTISGSNFAEGSLAEANFTADAGIGLKAQGSITLTATGGSGGVFIEGGRAGESFGTINALSGGKANVDAMSKVDITASGAFNATGRTVELFGGSSAGYGAFAGAGAGSSGAEADFNADASVNLNVGSATITGATVLLAAGRETARVAHAEGQGSGGVANVKIEDGLHINSKGDVNISAANRGVYLMGGESAGYGALVEASYGGHAMVSANANVGIGGANVSITGASGIITNFAPAFSNAIAGGSNGGNATVRAHTGGSAELDASGAIGIKATGNLTLTVTGVGSFSGAPILGLAAGADNGRNASISASGSGAKAAENVDASVSLTGKTGVTMNAPIVLIGLSSLNNYQGESAGVHAGKQAEADFVTDGSVNISTKGAFTVSAGQVSITGASRLGYAQTVSAQGVGAKASAVNDAGVNINAATASILGGSVDIHGGYRTGSYSEAGPAPAVGGFLGGSASLTDSTDVNINATGAIKIAASDGLFVSGGYGAGFLASADASNGKANFMASAGVSLKGTSVTLTGASVFLSGGDSGVRAATASAEHNGQASVTGQANVSLTATTGNIKVKGTRSVFLLGGGSVAGGSTFSNNGSSNFTSGSTLVGSASHHYTQKTVTQDFGVNDARARATGKGATAQVTGSGNVILNAKGDVSITTTNNASGSGVRISGGYGAGNMAQASAQNGGVAGVNAVSGISIAAGGNLTLTSARNLQVRGGNAAAKGASSSHHVSFTQKCVDSVGCSSFSFNTTDSANPVKAVGKGAIARSTADASITLSGTNVALTGSSVELLGGGSGAGYGVLIASYGGLASASAKAGVSVTAKQVLTAQAANSIYIEAGGGLAGSANLVTSGVKSQALVNADAGVNLKAASATLTAASGLIITAAGSQASNAGVFANGRGAKSSLDVHDSVNLNVTGALAMTASTGQVYVAGGSLFGENATVRGTGVSNSALLGGDAAVNINAGSIAITAGSDIGISGGGFTGFDAAISGSSGGKGEMQAATSVNFTSKGAVTLKAGNDVFISGGDGGFPSGGPSVTGLRSGTATLDADGTVNIAAAGMLTMTAGSDITVTGASGLNASITAISGGIANVSLKGGVDLTGHGTVTLKAKHGGILIQGGNDERLFTNLLTSFSPSSVPNGGLVTGSFDAGVTVHGDQDVNLSAYGGITVAAGAGETLAVGELRLFFPSGSAAIGNAWAGGSANLTGEMSAMVTAGHNLTVNAGTGGAGDLQVNGLGKNLLSSSFGTALQNDVTVRGGSSQAFANLTLTANAGLSAGNDMTLNVNGDASIVGGSLFSVRDDHGDGDVTITTNANASLHAGHDVVLNNITGDLTVGGIGVNSSHAGEMLIDAHGDSGDALVTGHADGSITAGNDIFTVTNLGGGLNLVAGEFVRAVGIGSASGDQEAEASANAILAAGHNVIVKGGGDLNVLGGLFNTASATGSGFSSGTRAGRLEAKASVTAGAAVNLTFTGAGVIAGGDSLTDLASLNGVGFSRAEASADESASITAGTTLKLKVGGSLLVRGGGSDGPSAFAIGGGNSATATANVSVNLTAGGNMTIVEGGSGASIVGGNGNQVKVISAFSFNQANADIDSDVNVNAGGSLMLKVHGNLTVAGGPGAGASFVAAGDVGSLFGTLVPAVGGGAHGDVSAAVNLTAGSALTIKMTSGGQVAILGGGQGASNAFLEAVGSGDSATLNVTSGVNINAVGALDVTGALAGPSSTAAVTLQTQLLATSSGFPFVGISGAGNVASVTGDSSIKIHGNTVNLGTSININANSGSSIISGSGVSLDGTISVSDAHGPITFTAFHPMAGGSYVGGAHFLDPMGAGAILSASGGVTLSARSVGITAGSSFSMLQSLFQLPATTPASVSALPITFNPGALNVNQVTVKAAPASNPATLNVSQVTVKAAPAQDLGTVASQAQVLSLEALAATAPAASLPQTGAPEFTPVDLGGYNASFAGACKALVVKASGTSCSTGGK